MGKFKLEWPRAGRPESTGGAIWRGSGPGERAGPPPPVYSNFLSRKITLNRDSEVFSLIQAYSEVHCTGL